MNTNIVAYLIKTKGMTQTDIATKLKSADKDTLGVSQALVSKWNRGEKIPKDREIEMLKLADLFWELKDKYTEDDDFLHTENLVLIDQHRRIRGVYNGTLSLETKRLIEDIKLILE